MKEGIATNYASNAVACKLWSLVESPIEHVLGLALFEKLSALYERWQCWVYSETEYLKLIQSRNLRDRVGSFAVVPQLSIANVGRVDFAVFIPGLTTAVPLIVLECDGHNFHERTKEQASKDRKRDRTLLSYDIPVFRFTGTDIVCNSAQLIEEIADFLDRRADEKEICWFQENGIDVASCLGNNQSFYAPYGWPRLKPKLAARVDVEPAKLPSR